MTPDAAQAPQWSYPESLAWLYDRQRLGIKLGLEKVQRLLDHLGNPHDSFKAIHVAGTNGKGSVCRMMAAVLNKALNETSSATAPSTPGASSGERSRHGAHVGLTTSPHLVSFTERIEIDGRPISQDSVARLLATIRPHVDALDAADDPPTFFEIVTALAFCAFRDAGVTWAVVETGLGGRLDATNVLDPVLTVITNVELDHQAMLGNTIAEIAYEKSGILKPGVPLVTAATGEALLVINARSHVERAPVSIVGKDYHVVKPHDVKSHETAHAGNELILQRPTGESRYALGLAGAHQWTNAAVVVAAVDALRKQGLAISERALREGLRSTTHAGRLETLRHRGVEVLVDGAHNPAAAHALRRHLAAIGWSGFHLVAGFCADKEWSECLAQWAPLAERVWAVPVRNPRSLDPSFIVGDATPIGIPATVSPDARTALDAAVAAGAQRILVAGSLFLAGEARAAVLGLPLEEIRGTQ